MTALTLACSSPAADGPDGPPGATRSPAATVSAASAPTTDSAPTTGAPPDDVTATTAPGPCHTDDPLLQDAVWIERADGPSLEVTPTPLLRRCALADVGEAVWDELLALVPEADTPGMAAQLTCHVRFAPTKDVWHLEPWRPVVDTPELIATRCNPGGPDPDLP